MKYRGVKLLEDAIEMNLRDYNEYRGFKLPDTEDGDKEGFLVEYEITADNKPNHPAHQGYISWSPKEVFVKSYKKYDSWSDRVIVERDELQTKIDKLSAYLLDADDNSHEIVDIDYLRKQLAIMHDYHAVLLTRLQNV